VQNEPNEPELSDADSAKEYLPFLEPRESGLEWPNYGLEIYDLLYRYEPYYIIKGWNHIEKRTPNEERVSMETRL